MERRWLPTAYGMLWFAVVGVFVGLSWLALTRGQLDRIAPGELDSGDIRPIDQPGASIEEGFVATDLTLRGAELTVSSADGDLRMRIYADLGAKRDNVYSIEQGGLLFTLENEDTLLLRLSNATYRREAGVITVRGTLTGYITEGGQFFQASELLWDESARSVSTQEVRYVSPSLEVRGERMNIDLETGTVRFDGEVEVGV